MKRGILINTVLILAALGIVGTSYPGFLNFNTHTKLSVDKITKNEYVYGSEIELETYYQEVMDELTSKELNLDFTYEEFVEGFETHDYSITEYCDILVPYLIKNKDLLIKEEPEASILSIPTSSAESSENAFYILNSFSNPEVTPEDYFSEGVEPEYSDDSYDYSCIKVGDILYETNTSIGGHVALVVDINHQSDHGTYIQTIEAVGQGVSYGFVDSKRINDYGVKVLRVDEATSSQIETAVNFSISQIGKPYDFNITRLNTSSSSTSWYCSELVFASYKSAGIDLGMVMLKFGVDYLDLGCLPSDIYWGYVTYEKCILNQYYFDLKIGGRGKWKVKVMNNSTTLLTLWYNKTMCFENDAKNWQNLNNISSVVLYPGKSTIIDFSENLFATDIAVCTQKNDIRYVTYAHNLSNDFYRLNVFYNEIDLKN